MAKLWWHKKMRDAAYATNIGNGDFAIAGYLPSPGAFHIWSPADWELYKHHRKLPVWVAYSTHDPEHDAHNCLANLRRLHIPPGSPVALDLETWSLWRYAEIFGKELRHAGYLVWPYGSLNTIRSNPVLDGLWIAAYDGVSSLRGLGSHVVAKQYANPPITGHPYDLSRIRYSAWSKLWKLHPCNSLPALDANQPHTVT